jgi:hypothetical protein
MKTDPAHDWTPVSRTRFDDILNEDVAQLPSDALAMYEAHKTGIEERLCNRSDECGIERIFVVARAGERLLFFDDVEDEFSIGVPDGDGVLRDWGGYGTLNSAIRSLQAEVPK